MNDKIASLNVGRWDPRSAESMLESQIVINEKILSGVFSLSTLRELQNDLINRITSTCSVCGDQQSSLTDINIEHIHIKKTWGYGSNHDYEEHSLTLCNTCYDLHILNGPLGKFVKIRDYH